MTPRLLETLIRLSTAHAKSRLSIEVDEEDVMTAYDILLFACNQDHETLKQSGRQARKKTRMDNEKKQRKADKKARRKDRYNDSSDEESASSSEEEESEEDVPRDFGSEEEDEDNVPPSNAATPRRSSRYPSYLFPSF